MAEEASTKCDFNEGGFPPADAKSDNMHRKSSPPDEIRSWTEENQILLVYCHTSQFSGFDDWELKALSTTKYELEKSISAWRPANWGLKIAGSATDNKNGHWDTWTETLHGTNSFGDTFSPLFGPAKPNLNDI